MRYIDALYACAKFSEAAAALQDAVAADNTFKTIPEYKVGLILDGRFGRGAPMPTNMKTNRC